MRAVVACVCVCLLSCSGCLGRGQPVETCIVREPHMHGVCQEGLAPRWLYGLHSGALSMADYEFLVMAHRELGALTDYGLTVH